MKIKPLATNYPLIRISSENDRGYLIPHNLDRDNALNFKSKPLPKCFYEKD